MPLYEFVCNCGNASSTQRGMDANTMDKSCPHCGEDMSRIFSSPAFHRFETHFSQVTGQEVGSMKQFKQQLKRAGEEQTARDGIPRNYVPTEVKPVEGPGTDSQARVQRERGTPGFERKRLYFNT